MVCFSLEEDITTFLTYGVVHPCKQENSMSLKKIINFQVKGDERGALVALESEKNVPFKVERIYYIYGTKPGVNRGFHAHKTLTQLAICIAGECLMTLDNGNEREDILLNSPTQGLLIDAMIWHEMHNFSSDCVLVVLANDYYDEDDYIRDYSSFKKWVSI